MKKFRVCKSFTFSAAHWLENTALSQEEQKAIFGKCCGFREECDGRFPHGHTYKLEVVIEGVINPKTGMVINFADIKKVVNEKVINYFDHKCLNLEVQPFSTGTITTAENMVSVIFDRLSLDWHGRDNTPKLVSVKVWEGPESWAEITIP